MTAINDQSLSRILILIYRMICMKYHAGNLEEEWRLNLGLRFVHNRKYLDVCVCRTISENEISEGKSVYFLATVKTVMLHDCAAVSQINVPFARDKNKIPIDRLVVR